MPNDEKGSVMMEYIIVTALVAVPIFLVWHGSSILGYPGIYDFSTGLLKEGGKGIQGFFQWITSGIALPVP